jgi:glycosyltransferase involved in cell wall biosynthesis
MFGAMLSGLPFSFTAHAKDIYTSNPEQLRQKIAMAEFVVTCTHHNKTYLDRLSDQTTPIYCIYHGIDLDLFSNENIHIEPPSPYRLFTVARLTEKKGLPTVYRALKILADENVDFHHTLIGDGDDREKILHLIKDLGLGERCSWLGTRTHSEVLEHFRSSDLFVLGCEIAENGDRDGIPNVLVESLAMGVPSVATAVSAIPEILLDGTTGLTVAEKDPAALAAAMRRSLTDFDLRRKLITNGRKHVHEHFSNKELIGTLAAIFQSINPALAADPATAKRN